jgi:hypothetical protein
MKGFLIKLKYGVYRAVNMLKPGQHNLKKLIPILIVLFWLAATFLLLYRHILVPRLGAEAKLLLPENEDKWMGIYLKGRKIGFASSRFSREIDGYNVYEEIRMKLKVLNTLQDIHTVTKVSLSPELRVRSFKFAIYSTQDLEMEGRFQGKTLTVDIKTGSSRSRKELQLEELPQMNITVVPYLLKKGFRPGMRVKMPVFDPLTLSVQKMVIEVMGREKIQVNGIAVEAFKISGDLNGVSYIMWVDEKGNELKAESPLGFTLVAEPMEEAVKFYGSSSDIILQTAVPFDLKLPAVVSYLKIKIRGINFKELDLDSERQILNGNIMEIKQEDIGNFKSVSLPISGMEQYLKETPFIQSGDERIIELANKIIGDEKNALSVSRLLWLWVYENIEKRPSLTVPSAVDVLKTKKGDCNEHTVLYTALARAAGLPVRMDVGLVYRDGFFYYHAWPEVFAGRWIAIDPTLGQFPADATHLKLISGDIDKQVVLLKIINKISLKGIEYK